MLNDQRVFHITQSILRTRPRYPNVFYGVLYGTHCSSPLLVPVAVDHGSPKDEPNLPFLVTEHWLGPTSNVVNTERFRFTLDHFPGNMACELGSNFTVHTVSQLAFTNPKNQVISLLSKDNIDWVGDILVVKHKDGDPAMMVSATVADLGLVNLLVTWGIEDGNYL